MTCLESSSKVSILKPIQRKMKQNVWITWLSFRRRRKIKIKKKHYSTWLPFSMKKKKDKICGRRRETSSLDVDERDARVLCFELYDYSLLKHDNFPYIYVKRITTMSNKNSDKILVLFTTVSGTNRGDMYFNFNILIRVHGQALFVMKKYFKNYWCWDLKCVTFYLSQRMLL